MSQVLNEDQLRVTSIPHSSANLVIFSGVPLKKDSYRVNTGKYYVTVKVNPDSLPAQPSIGQHWLVKGLRTVAEVSHGDYLMQQHTYENPENIECQLPETGEQLIQFIAKEKDFKGIGESKARALWEALGRDFHSTIQSDTSENRMRLKGLLSDESIEALFAGYAKYKNLAYCNWMSERKIPASVHQRLLKHHGEKSIHAIQENPYLLIGFGMAFEQIDIAVQNWQLKNPVTPDDDRRLSAALEIAIRKEIEKGHTYSNHTALRPHLNKLLNNRELVGQAFRSGHDKVQFILNHEKGTYHPTAQLLMENVVAKRLKKGSGAIACEDAVYEAIKEAMLELPYDLTDQQLQAVETCLTHNVSCITGGAGTGKTTVLRTVLKAYHSLGYDIHAVALSGRAAMRLHESIGFLTMTIARLLREEPIAPSEEPAKHLLVIDEASMIDLPTMYRIVTHLDPSVRIIFSGDPNQLPPIACGKVLADIVESGVIPITKLDIVKRQQGSTGIPEYSACINRGEVPPELTTGAINFHETPPDQIVPVCQSLYAESPAISQIVSATKAMTANLNQHCQKLVNPNGVRLQFSLYGDDFFLDLREGDPILFTKNNYSIGIQNGSLGVLTSTEGKSDGEEQSFGAVTLDTGETIAITEDVLDCMELGYAITLHKAQGSQFPRIIVALQKGRITDRAWLYTAITRAEAEVHIVGSAEEFAGITKMSSNANRRNSYLKTLMGE